MEYKFLIIFLCLLVAPVVRAEGIKKIVKIYDGGYTTTRLAQIRFKEGLSFRDISGRRWNYEKLMLMEVDILDFPGCGGFRCTGEFCNYMFFNKYRIRLVNCILEPHKAYLLVPANSFYKNRPLVIWGYRNLYESPEQSIDQYKNACNPSLLNTDPSVDRPGCIGCLSSNESVSQRPSIVTEIEDFGSITHWGDIYGKIQQWSQPEK